MIAMDPAIDGHRTGFAPGGKLVAMRGVARHFPAGRGHHVRAVDGVDLDIPEGAAVGLVGESGSGKTTLARCLLRLAEIDRGSITFNGEDLAELSGQQLRRRRTQMQMVFQDPAGSLDPRQTVRSIVEEPLRLLTELEPREREERIVDVIERVRLSKAHLERYPHQLSGGQQQRVGIARAIVTRPALCVLDEPTSALDWPIRAEILDLLGELRQELGLAYLLISHDLGAVRHICERIAVMYLGRIVEVAPTARLFEEPQHPYTRALLSARLEPELGAVGVRARLGGEPPSPLDPPAGCHLHPRCPIAVEACSTEEQRLENVGAGHSVACMRVTRGEDVSWPAEWRGGAVVSSNST